MTTDLSNKSVVLPDCMMPDGADPCAGYQQLARRLEEAQKKINMLNSLCECHENIHAELAKEMPAIKSKVAAEALEERAAVYEAEPYPESEYYATDLRAKAAEYRAKATEAGRKE